MLSSLSFINNIGRRNDIIVVLVFLIALASVHHNHQNNCVDAFLVQTNSLPYYGTHNNNNNMWTSTTRRSIRRVTSSFVALQRHHPQNNIRRRHYLPSATTTTTLWNHHTENHSRSSRSRFGGPWTTTSSTATATATTTATTTTTRRALSSTTKFAASVAVDTESTVDSSSTRTVNNGVHDSLSPSALFDGLTSRPVPNGNWDPANPLQWCQDFGSRSKERTELLEPLVHLQPGDEGYFEAHDEDVPSGVTLVRTREQARTVLEALNAADSSIFHACDTEVMDIDLKHVGPVGNGYVTCVSIYSGPDFDYGLGDGPGTALWIDNLDDAYGVLQEFKEWFENPNHLKVWHNYGFDRHVMWNEGIDVQGFGGDTMHMARLEDTSRMVTGRGGYSLEALTDDVLGRRKVPMKEIFGVPRLRKDGSEGAIVDIPPVEVMQRDPKHRTKWIMYSCYDAEGTYLLFHALKEKLEKMPWIPRAMDGTFLYLYQYYHDYMRPFGEVLTDMERRGIRVNAKDYLANIEVQARQDRVHHTNVFRKWASSKIGPDGLALNLGSATQLATFLFGGSTNEKTKEPTETVRVFRVARAEIPDDAMEAYRERDAAHAAAQQENANGDDSAEDYLDTLKAAELKDLCKEYDLKVSGKKSELQERLRGFLLTKQEKNGLLPEDLDAMSEEELEDECTSRGLSTGTLKQMKKKLLNDIHYQYEIKSATTPRDSDGFASISEALESAALESSVVKEILDNVKSKAQEEPKWVDVTVNSIGMKPDKFTAGGAPSVTADVLRNLAGDPLADEPKYGKAYDFFGGGDEGHNACVALFSLCSIGSIDTMIANFLGPLQALSDDQSRVHCSLNLNTETGRLSSRKPNLQNQPALEKDKYKIRASFEASPGNNFIVADYGQLELRLLASMTRCKSMIDAFQAGGDFHSRTALDMFDYVQKAVDDGECLLEWDYAKGDPPKPLLKDLFASERRKAKTLNFSIAYGKTAHGLSADWGVSTDEANKMLEAWYAARPEVEKWQANTKAFAKKNGVTRTLMGRYRQLPAAQGKDKRMLGGALRASINTPIQGGAADVAMMAMVKINKSETLKRLGWILLMQIHDEVILEGPQETAEEAFKEVIECMEHPWVLGLQETAVPLLVDGSYVHNNWYDAK